jgi:hypothetical protein
LSSQTSQDSFASREKQYFRPTRIAIVHGSSIFRVNISQDEIHAFLQDLFKDLNIPVFSIHEMTQAGESDLLASQAYDVIGLIGEAGEFSPRKTKREEMDSIVMSFAPKNHFDNAKKYLSVSDALVLCDSIKKNWLAEVSQVVYRFFESLLVPSMLNIDVADVKRIASGIGIAFNIEDDEARRIIAKLPKDCLVAKSALLHFSCKDDVTLREIHSVSKSIALKKGLDSIDPQIDSHLDAKKLMRKVNVKMGIRVIDGDGDDSSVFPEKRISMTAILFGI